MNDKFFQQCEMVLFLNLVKLYENKEIEIKDFAYGDFTVENLKGLQIVDPEWDFNLKGFLTLPGSIQQSVVVSLKLRLKEYCARKGINV